MTATHRVEGDRVEVIADAVDLHKIIAIGDNGTLECRWHWPAAAFPAGSWFATELSSSAALEVDAPGAERWDYEIETVAKSESGFDRTIQGNAIVLRWPAAVGEAIVVVRPQTR
jgi:hypothetical protein